MMNLFLQNVVKCFLRKNAFSGLQGGPVKKNTLYFPALSLDTNNGHTGLAGGHGHIWPKWPNRAIYDPYGHDHRLNRYTRYGYLGKEQTNTNSTI